jgi:hypothetical protein
MTTKIGPNAPCPCGSGKKFKKCCRDAPGRADGGWAQHTPADRATAFTKLDAYVDARWEGEENEALDEFWGRFGDRAEELPPHLVQQSEETYEAWFAFDRRLDDGERIVDHFLRDVALTAAERSFLLALRGSSLRPYEVVETVPGSSIKLRDLVEGTDVTVNERSASRTLSRTDCLAARVIPRGCSGRPEMELGVLSISQFVRNEATETIRRLRDKELALRPGLPLDEAYEEAPPTLHQIWAQSIFEPAVPDLRNNDGEELVTTRITFDVADEFALLAALDGAAADGIEREGEGERRWLWSRQSKQGKPVVLATIALSEAALAVETSSVARGARARALLERLASAVLRHRGTVHEDLRRQVVEAVVARRLGRESAMPSPAAPSLPPEINEAIVLQHYAEHYRRWVDEPVPALDGKTPRDAAKSPQLRPRTEELIRGILGLYERSLKDNTPAYDPSWMWAELGLDDPADVPHPPPLAHERVAERAPGLAEAIRAAVTRWKSAPSFSEKSTTLIESEIACDLDMQRAVRARGPAEAEQRRPQDAAPYLESLVNLELHGRKIFWVDGALAFQLDHTDAEIPGGELRLPFPSCALVFTDRHVLSLAERLLARREDDPLRGQILRAATVFVTERQTSRGRAISLTFALDALGPDLPSLARFDLQGVDEASLPSLLDAAAPREPSDASLPDRSPARGLLRLALNAILYATSASVEPQLRAPPEKRSQRSQPALPALQSAESVFHLPGTIDIRRVRQLQELGRAPEGRTQLVRFLVRGHWRRAQQGRADQRLRWIEPYWKGPELAAVIEKAYRLKE